MTPFHRIELNLNTSVRGNEHEWSVIHIVLRTIAEVYIGRYIKG